MRIQLALAALLTLIVVPATAADDASLIEALLSTVGDSECTFIRNGKEHTAEDAEAHLRMKYRRGKRHAKTVETFIERIATKSSMSGRLYMIRCEDADARPTAQWLTERLDDIRGDKN
ncbi:MAG: DUF5329 domain-containing protein [Pseudomonadota bacterium]